MATFLLELFSEEIPSRMQRGAAEQLERLMVAGFNKAGLQPSSVKTYVSPRHLAIVMDGLPAKQADISEERKGPKIGAPEQAMKGFLTSTGLTLDQCEQRDGYYFATIHRKGRKTAEVAKEISEAALKDFSWPKSMKWGAHGLQWVRPLHRITALFDSEVVPVQFGHLTASNVTEGHRFLAPKPITIKHANDYVDALKAASVLVDYATRRDHVATEVAALAKHHNLRLVEDEALLNEVTGLVEWPVPLLGQFDQKFLDMQLPREVLISEMKTHQRYFALETADGKLSNRFIAVANRTTSDDGKQVVAGNARVLRARLSDGEFYWAQDQKTKLDDWGKKLSDVVFHAKVGMMSEKVARIEALALKIADTVAYKDQAAVKRAAQLCKADLTSGMVGEFPELQGIMGRYYALAQGESPEIADAIRDHYKPVGAGDTLPATELSAIIAIADKLDSIISLFAAGEKPTGSKDPFALRRAALGALRILLERGWNMDLLPLITDKKVAPEIADFFRDRLKTMLRDDGIRHDVLDASFSLQDQGFNALAISKRAHTLTAWLATPGGKDALAAIKRALNILAAEEKKTKTQFKAGAAASLPAEKQLAAVISKPAAEPAALESLTGPINQFFDDVLVTEPEFREARLGLLAGVRATALNIADFSKIEG